MRGVLFLLGLLGFQQALASSPNFDDLLKDAPCQAQVKSKVGLKLMKQTWVPAAVSIPGVPLQAGIAFRDTRVKTAYQIWTQGKRTAFLVQDLQKKKELLTLWDASKACTGKSITKTLEPRINPNIDGYTDDDLYKTMRANNWGVIYVWSPHMPYSVEGLKEIKSAVLEKGGDLTILMDGKASREEAMKWVMKDKVNQAELTQVASAELFAREISLHYPIAFLYKDGFLSNRTYIGHKENKVYQKWIDRELAELKKDLQ